MNKTLNYNIFLCVSPGCTLFKYCQDGISNVEEIFTFYYSTGIYMKKYLAYLGRLVVVLIFVGAIYLLYQKLQAYSLEEIQNAMAETPTSRILLAVGITALSYLILMGYDWIALIAIKKPIPFSRVAIVSFIGQTVSYNFGALLGGTTVRYRLYTGWGFAIADIVRLVLMLAITFWVGALGLCGIVFMVAPPTIPQEFHHVFPTTDMRILGVMLFAITICYFIACHFVRKTVNILGKEFSFPTLKIALIQTFVACLDLVVAASVMFVLFSPELNLSFGQFLPSYLMAQFAVILTHVPGGVGVFELVILHLTHTPHIQLIIAGVLLFRIIYFIIPLLLALALFVLYEIRQNSQVLRIWCKNKKEKNKIFHYR